MSACSTISEAEYERLKELYQQAASSSPELKDGMSQPFCGVIGSGYASAIGPKIVYVGKATLDGPKGGELPSLETLSLEWKRKAFDGFPSHFWYQMVRVVETIYCVADIPLPAEPRQVVAWTNLMKISGNGANPSRELAKRQRDLSVEILSEEIKRLDPDVIWIVTGDFESNLVYRVFGGGPRGAQWDPPDDLATIHRISPNGRSFVAWTRHPQGQPLDIQRQDTEHLAHLAVDFWRRDRNKGPI